MTRDRTWQAEEDLVDEEATYHATGCRACDYLGQPCDEHAFQLAEELRERDRDRFIEAILGARLRFHADPSGNANESPPSYWMGVYGRWAELYRGGRP